MKKEYVAPTVEDLGSVQDLTLGQSGSWHLDADFPNGSLFGDATFS